MVKFCFALLMLLPAWAAPSGSGRVMAPGNFFIENRGQGDEEIRYYLQGKDRTFAFTERGVRVEVRSAAGAADRIDWQFVDANPGVRVTAEGLLPGVVNYHLGELERHRAGVRTYSRVRYHEVWPGIDLVYSAEATRIKYELRVAAGADAGRIRFRYGGASGVSVRDGGLVVATGAGEMADARPVSFQGARKVSSAWRVMGDGVAGFELGEYDRGRELVIDPAILVRSMVFGSARLNHGRSVATDASGNVFAGGSTDGALSGISGTNAASGGDDGFLIKFGGNGVLQYLTYIGGTGQDLVNSIDVDANGTVYAEGQQSSNNFPILSTNIPNCPNCNFVVKLAASGTLAISTTIQGARNHAIAANLSGDIFLTGDTFGGMAVTSGPTSLGYDDAFLMRISSNGVAKIVESRLIGGSIVDQGTAIALDTSGDIYVTGNSSSPNFPANLGAITGTFSWIQKYSQANLSTPVYSVALGASGVNNSLPNAIAVDSSGNAFVVGDAPFPLGITPQTGFTTGRAFLIKLDASGNTAFLDRFPGEVTDLAVDAGGRVHITGRQLGSFFGVSSAGNYDVSYAVVSNDGKQLLCAQLLGGTGFDLGQSIALSGSSAWITGGTYSNNFPVAGASGALAQQSVGGDENIFLAEISCSTDCAPAPSDMAAWFPMEPLSGGSQTGNLVNNVASPVNGTRVYGTGAVNQALTFDGTSTYVAVGNSTNNVDITTTDFSFDFWMRIPSSTLGLAGRIPILDKRFVAAGSPERGYLVYVENGRLGLRMCTTACSDYLASTTMPTDGKLHFHAITVKRSSTTGVLFYLDGVVLTGSGNPTAQQASLTTTADLWIGRLVLATGYFKGDLDEIEIFKKELSAKEIADIYNADALGKCPLPVCHFPELSGTVDTGSQNGTAGTFTVTLRNTGTTAASNINYEVFLSSGTSCANPVATIGNYTLAGPLNAGQTTTVNNLAGFLGGVGTGSYTMCVRVDPLNSIKECDETNNTGGTRGIIITPICGLPNFSVSSVIVSPGSLASGGTATVTITILNAGVAYSGTPAGTVKIYLATSSTATTGTLLGTFPMPPLATGTTTLTYSVIIPANVGTGTYYFIVQPDADGEVPECDEGNNRGASGGVGVRQRVVRNPGGPVGWQEPIREPMILPTPVEPTPCVAPFCVPIDTDPCATYSFSMTVPGNMDVYAAIGRPVVARSGMAAPSSTDGPLGHVPFQVDPALIDHDLRATGSGTVKTLRIQLTPEQLAKGPVNIYFGYVINYADADGTITLQGASCKPGPVCDSAPTDAVTQYSFEDAFSAADGTIVVKDSKNGLDGVQGRIAFLSNYGVPWTPPTQSYEAPPLSSVSGQTGNGAFFDNQDSSGFQAAMAVLPADARFDMKDNDITIVANVKFDPAKPFAWENTIFGRWAKSVSKPGTADDFNASYSFSTGLDSNGVAHPGFMIYDGVQGSAGYYPFSATTLEIPRDNQWHCVAVRVRRNGTLTFAVDGKTEDVTSPFGPFGPMDTDLGSSITAIGWKGFTPSNYNTHFIGSLDELKFFQRGLSDDELKTLCVNCGELMAVTLNTNPVLPASGYTVAVDDQTAPVSAATAPQVATNSSVTAGDTVLLDAPATWSTPGTYYTLTNYTSGSYTGVPSGGNTVTVTPTASTVYTANYSVLCYVVTITWTPPLAGTAQLSPAPPPGYPANCYAPGTVLTIIASPNPGITTGTSTGTGGAGVSGTTVTVTGPGVVTVPFTRGNPLEVRTWTVLTDVPNSGATTVVDTKTGGDPNTAITGSTVTSVTITAPVTIVAGGVTWTFDQWTCTAPILGSLGGAVVTNPNAASTTVTDLQTAVPVTCIAHYKPTGPVACTLPPANMGAWYRFEETGAPFLDSAGAIKDNAANGTVAPAVVAGKVNKAVFFGTSANYLEAPGSTDLDVAGDLTLDAWIKVSLNNAAVIPILDRSDSTSANWRGYRLYLNTAGQLTLEMNNGGTAGRWTGTTNLNIAYWTHVAAVVRRTGTPSVTLYVNGNAETLSAVTGAVPTGTIAPVSPLRIGYLRTLPPPPPPASNSGTEIAIDELEIIQEAVTQAKLQALVLAAGTGKCDPSVCVLTPATGMYEFERVTTPILDSANAINGAVNGVVSHTGTVGLTQIAGPAGKGNAAYFNGDTGVALPNDKRFDAVDHMTIVAWVKVDGTKAINNEMTVLGRSFNTSVATLAPQYRFALATAGVANGAIAPATSPTTLGYFINDGKQGTSGYYPYGGNVRVPRDNNWHCVAMRTRQTTSATGDQVDFFVDGTTATATTFGIPDGKLVPVSSPYGPWIGSNGGVNNFEFIGGMDGVQFFDRTLSDGEIDCVCKGTAAPPVPVIVNTNLVPPRGFTVGLSPVGTATDVYNTSVAPGPGYQVTVTPVSKLDTAGTTRWDFRNSWSFNGVPDATLTLPSQAVTVPPAGGTYTANFSTFYKVDVLITGSCTSSLASGFYPATSIQTVTVTGPLKEILVGAVLGGGIGFEQSLANGGSFRINAPTVFRIDCGNGTVGVTVNTSPANIGAIVGIAGATQANSYSTTLPGGSAQTVTATTPVVSGGSYYQFQNWTPSGPAVTLPSTGSATYTANYLLRGYVVTASGCGVNIGPASQAISTNPLVFPAGTTLSATANPGSGQTFQNITVTIGGTTSTFTANPASFSLTGPATVTANCSSTLTLTVDTNPSQLERRIGATGPFVTTPVSATVSPATAQAIAVTEKQVKDGIGYAFLNWTGVAVAAQQAATTVQLTASATATANFQDVCYLVNTTVTGGTGGTIALSPASGGLAGFPANCYPKGVQVRVTASASQDNALRSGTIAIGSATQTTTNPITFINITAPTSITATFAARPNAVVSATQPALQNGVYTTTVSFTNSTGAAGTNLRITGVAFTLAGVTLNTPLPVVYGNLPANGSGGAKVLTYTVPPAVAAGTTFFMNFTVEVTNASGDVWVSNPSFSQTTVQAPASGVATLDVVNPLRTNNPGVIAMTFSVPNSGNATAGNVQAAVSVTVPNGSLQIANPVISLGTIDAGKSAPLAVSLAGAPGANLAGVTFNIQVSLVYTQPSGTQSTVLHTWNVGTAGTTQLN